MATPIFDLSNLDGSNGFRIDGAVVADYFGESVNNAGDVNGDGFDDLIIGAPWADLNGKNSGSSYVVFGKASGFDATLNVSTLNGSNGFRLDGEAEFDLSGEPVSSAGDINGDGFDDVIVSASRNDANGVDSGSSYIVFGRASGFDAAMDLSSLDGTNGFRLSGASGDFLGSSVSSVGDINGDGFDDVSIGSNYTDPQTGQTSLVSYTVFGKASGFNAVMESSSIAGSNGFRQDGGVIGNAGDVNGDGFEDFTVGSSVVFGKASGFSAELDPSNLDGNNGFSVDGQINYSAGDVNGDGFDDLLAAKTNVSPNGILYDSSYILFGKSSGFDAMLELSSLDGSNGFRIDEGYTYGQSGSISAAGDINGDGFDDVVIGSFDASTGYESDANAYVLFGKASGFSAAVQLDNMDINTGIRFDNGDQGFLGLSVSDAGDINGDGIDDLIVSAPGARYPSNGGMSYVIFGRSDFGGGGLPVIPGTLDDDVLRGTAAAEQIDGGDGNDVLIGRGGADVFRGGAGVDQIKVPDLNFASIDGGTGTDILHLDGKDLHLDLASVGDKIQNIETICIYGRGDNTLSLTADSVLDLSDTSNTLTLHGNAGDRVTVLDDGWVDGGVKGFYHTYTNDDAVLLVGANLAIDFVA